MSRPALPAGITVFERGWLSSNNTLLRGAGENVLIDTGYLTHAEQTLALVQHALQGETLHTVVNTHLHSDHCGGNALLQTHYPCQTLIAASESEKVRTWDQQGLSFVATGQQCQPFHFQHTLQPGQTLCWAGMEWQALAAPGHDPHSLVFYNPQHKILISADALWEHGFGVIFPELAGEPGFAETRATLDMIAKLDVAVVIPGHGAIFSDVSAALQRAYARLDWMEQNPLRNAHNALKVLLKFLLIERGRIALTELPQMLAQIPLFIEVNQRYLQCDPGELAEWAVRQLLHSNVATVEEGYLYDLN